MQRKFNFLIFSWFTFIICSCSEQKSNISERKSNLKEIDLVLSNLPKNISLSKYNIIMRFGSNDFSSEYTAFCYLKTDINKEKLKIRYFSINTNICNRLIESDFELKNNKILYSSILFKKSSHSNIKTYRDSLILNECVECINSNIYVLITSEGSFLLNDKSLNTRKKLKAIYEQISSSEYYNSISLINSKQNKKIKEKLILKNYPKDSLTFKVNYEIEGAFW